MATEELQVLLTARDDMSQQLRQVRSTVRSLEQEMAEANAEFRRTGDPATLARYQRLRREWEQASEAQRRLAAELARTQRRIRDLGNEGERTGNRLTRAFRRAGQVFQNDFVAGLSAGAMVAFGAQAVQAFASVEDSTAALTTTFGEVGSGLVAWSKTSAAALNLSQVQAMEASQSFATFGQSAGLTGETLQKFAVDLTGRAADMASYYGSSVQDALDAIRSGLAGETEPLRRFAVMLDDATMRQKALAMGLIETTSQALTPQQKTLTAYQLILEKTSAAQGDVERTSDSMGNRIKDAQQNFEDFKVTAGETVAIGLGPLMDQLNGAMTTFNKLPGPVQQAAIAIGAIGAASLIATPRIIALNTALASRGGLIGLARTNWRAAARGVTIFASAYGGALLAAQMTGEGVKNTGDMAKDMENALWAILNPGVAEEMGQRGEAVADAIAGFFGQDYSTRMEAAGEATTAFDAQLTQLVADGKLSEAQAQFSVAEASAEKWGKTSADLMKLLPGYQEALAGVIDVHGDYTPHVRAGATETERLAMAQAHAEAASLRLAGAMDKVDRIIARNEAIRSYREALRQFVEDPSKRAGEAVASSMLQAARAFKDPLKQQQFVRENFQKIKAATNDPGIPAGIRGGLLDLLREVNEEAGGVKESVMDLDGLTATINIITRRVNSLGFASGGLVMGAGTGTSDSIPAMLSNGEYVVRAAAVRAIGVDQLERINRADMTPVSAIPARGGDGASLAAPGGATVNIGTINADRGVDVQAEVLHALLRADRIGRERR